MSNPVFEAAGLRVFERGWLSANNVLFPGDDGGDAVLVDSGYSTHANQTVALVRHAIGDRHLGRVVNTHLHSDHCGGNAALQEAFDCAIAIPAGEADKVARWDESLLTFRDTGQQCPRFTSHQRLRAGELLALGGHDWQVLAAPGHDPESVALYQPHFEILISADALWENGFGVVFPELEGNTAFDAVGKTLDTFSALRVAWVIPGHGSPFRGLAPAIARARSRLKAFVADPARHARHAAKVLIKFHLLEVESVDCLELRAWLASTRYMSLCHRAHFSEIRFGIWCDELVQELAASKALVLDGQRIRDH